MSYKSEIQRIDNLTVSDIIRVSKQYVPDIYKKTPWNYKDSRGRTLEHGTAVLETEEQCCAYMAAYGPMHHHKLMRALDDDEFPYKSLLNGFEIYDWACGQGIGTVTLIERLRTKGILYTLRKVTLEEPSDAARTRAVLHVRQTLGDADTEVVETPQYLPSDYGDNSNAVSKIDVKQPCAVHIFSNILDIEAVSLKKVSKLITSSGQKHIVLCVGPANLNESRILSFKNYFYPHKISIFTDYIKTDFGHHPTGKAYGCLINSFTYNLSSKEKVLYKYKYFAPLQFFAAYTDGEDSMTREECAFEVIALYDMTAHRNLCPVYALLSNMISRGMPTYASDKVTDALKTLPEEEKYKSMKAVARIQKTLVEALISERLDLTKESWNILINEDDTEVAQLAIEDFYELYHKLIAMTQDYDAMVLPQPNVYVNKKPQIRQEFDIIIDISIRQNCNAEDVVFRNYKINNGCYYIVRSSERKYEERVLYTTERIKYKPFVEKDHSGNYYNIEENCANLRYFLNLLFGKEDFRPGQLPILSRALQLKSVIGLLPTGGGKSLTYQLAAMLQPAVTLVVDPLKGLMKDQYDGLICNGIDCISYINGDITKDFTEGKKRELALTSGQYQIMFLSPERLSIYRFRNVLRSMRESNIYFAYGVIDEVHCVSEWGHDFRLAYLHLGRNLFNYVLPKEVEGEDNHISLFGLTATASFDVLADVQRELSGPTAYALDDDATIRYENTNRLELQYYVREVRIPDGTKRNKVDEIKVNELHRVIDEATDKIMEIQDEDAVETIKERFIERENLLNQDKIGTIYDTELDVDVIEDWYKDKQTDTAAIVFCPYKSDKMCMGVPAVAVDLGRSGIKHISTYTGGDNTERQDNFLQGKTSLMVATKAFGMGIDKSNVRMTFHLNYPGSLESFVQEAGRAGRDKKMALATIMYSPEKFPDRNPRTGKWEHFSKDYINNKFFYDNNFLGEEFEIYVMELLLNKLTVRISNEEIQGIKKPIEKDIKGIVKFINSYEAGTVLTYYIYYEEDDSVLDEYNEELFMRSMPLFSTPNARQKKNENGFPYIRDYGSAIYKDAIQKAIYRMCVIGLIDDFTEDYSKQEFRITTKCQEESVYYEHLGLYYRKYYSADRVESMINEVKKMARTEGVIMACLKHLTSFVYNSIAQKRARGILDMEQFCEMGINDDKDWKDTNEELKDFIYYYFNSKYAREGFVTFDASINDEIPFSLRDDTNHDNHTEAEITDFEIVRKYMRIVDSEIVNNDSQMDNVKHLQGAVRLIRRALVEANPVLNLLNIFCILFLGQQTNETLEEELYRDYDEAYRYYLKRDQLPLLKEYEQLLLKHSAINDTEYIEKVSLSVQLEEHLRNIKTISKNIKF